MSGTLYIVATPIGNLEDLTPRALKTLASVSLVAAEDTRHTKRLLFSIGAKPRLLALHEHNEEKVVSTIINVLKEGESVALVSDAGTPLVSDPGYRLVRAAHENGVDVSPLPGPSAVTAALSAAGLPTDRFGFEGFAPSKAAARAEWFRQLESETRTLIFFESVHRIEESLTDMVQVFGADRAAFIGRELSKVHEQCVHDTLGNLVQMLKDGTIVKKGEFVVIVSGAARREDAPYDVDRLLIALATKMSANETAKMAAELTGVKRNALYRRLLELRDT